MDDTVVLDRVLFYNMDAFPLCVKYGLGNFVEVLPHQMSLDPRNVRDIGLENDVDSVCARE
jgi:hypothetical protein